MLWIMLVSDQEVCMVKKTLVFLFMLVVLFSCSVNSCFAVSQVEAEQMLAKAENDLALAYTSVAQAECVGVNVSELLVKLEMAGVFLAEARNFYRVGDYEKAYLLAINCSETVSGVALDASSLRFEAEKAYSERLFVTAAVSSVGLSVLFVLSLFGWRFLKNWFLKRALKMRPEVRDNA